MRLEHWKLAKLAGVVTRRNIKLSLEGTLLNELIESNILHLVFKIDIFSKISNMYLPKISHIPKVMTWLKNHHTQL